MRITAAPVAGAPAALPNAINLLSSALPPQEQGDAWMSGFGWRSELCPTWQGFNPCTEQTEAPDPGGDSLNYARPVAYRVAETCPTRQSGSADRDRLVRKATAIASFAVAHELWTGELSDLDPYDVPDGVGGVLVGQTNNRLASPEADQLPPTANVMDAFASLESAVSDATRGQQVFLHAPLSVIARVGMNFKRVGNELRTATDAIVVPDAGYPGTGPDGTGTGWMYATGPVVVRLGPIAVEDTPGSTVDRRSNTQTLWAQRVFAATFDSCAHFAIQVTGQ